MKRLNFKFIFLCVAAIMIFITGCSVDTTFTVDGFTLNEEVYECKYSQDMSFVNISDLVKSNSSKGDVKYYYDEDLQFEITDPNFELSEGNNYIYCGIRYKNNKTITIVKLNLYKLKNCIVSFETGCKTHIDSIDVEEGTIIEKPTVELEKTGYAFEGWDYNFKKPIEDNITITAKWKANSYTVTYDPNGGEIEFGNTIVTYGEPYELDTPVREGYIFKGWKYQGVILTAKNWLFDKDVVVVAEWEAELRTYEIEYIIVGAVGPNLQRTYTNKEHVILKKPYKAGYKFAGWYTDGQFKSERVYELPVGTEGNLTLYSKWEKFHLEGATISFLGDSITTFYDPNSQYNSLYSGHNQYYYPLYSNTVKTVDKTWWYKVMEQTKTKLIANDSWSGSSCYNNGNGANQGAMNYNRINNLKGSDIVVVLIGTNDNVNGFTYEQFKNAYNTMLNRIEEVCPEAFIFCCTLGYSAYSGYYYTEARRLEFNKIITELTLEHNAQIIDLSSVQTTETYNKYLGDSLHPNADGMVAYANEVVKVIKEYVGA